DANEHETWAEAIAVAQAALKPVKKAAAKKAAPAKKAAAAPAKRAAKPKPEPEPEDDEEEEADEDADDDGYDVDEESLTAMAISELRSLADDYGIEHKGLSKVKLVRAILEAAEE